MSNLERRQRIDELKERLFLEIKNKGAGGGGAGYGAPEIPSYNAPAPAPAPSYNNDPLPSYGAPSIPSYGAFDGFNFNKGPGKVIEIPVPDLPIPDPIEFKAAVLRSKGRIASGLLHTKAGLLRAGANILAQKANALDKFAQAIPAIKANVINSLQGLGGGKGGGGYGAPPANNYGAPAPQVQPPPSYNAPAPQVIIHCHSLWSHFFTFHSCSGAASSQLQQRRPSRHHQHQHPARVPEQLQTEQLRQLRVPGGRGHHQPQVSGDSQQR